MTKRTSTVALKYQVDRTSQRNAERSIEDLRRELQEVPIELSELGTLARVGVGNLARQFRLAEQDIESAKRQLDLYNRSLEQTSRASVTAPGNVRGGELTERIDRTGTIGSQIAGGIGASELGNVVDLIGDLAGSVNNLGIAGLAAAGAVGALTLAFNAFNSEIERGRGALGTALSAQEQFYDSILELTSEQARARVQELERENLVASVERLEIAGLLAEAQRQTQELLTGPADALESAIRTAVPSAGALIDALQETSGNQDIFRDGLAQLANQLGVTPVQQLQERYNALNTEIELNNGLILRFTNGLKLNVFQYQDGIQAAADQAAALQRELAAKRDLIAETERLRQATIAVNLQDKTRRQALLDQASAEATRTREAVDQARQAETQLTLQFEERVASIRQNIRDAEIDGERTKQDRLEDIRRRALFEEQDAIADRDALSLVRQRRGAAEQARQTQVEQQRRLRDAQINAQRLYQTELNRYRAELNVRQQATQQSVNLAIQAANALATIQQQSLTFQIKAAEAAGQGVAAAFYNSAITSIFQLTGGGGLKPGSPTPGQFAGGIVKPFGSGMMTINVTGATTKTVTAISARQAEQVFIGALKALPLR